MTGTTEYKVRHGLIEYKNERDERSVAFRNMRVQLIPSEANRLLGHDAIVPVDVELEKAGQMMELPDTASDEQIIGWVSAAQPSEVRRLVLDRPMLADRIRAAFADVQKRLEEQQELLSGILPVVDETEDEIRTAAGIPAPGSADPNAQPEPPVPSGAVKIGEDANSGDANSGDANSGDANSGDDEGVNLDDDGVNSIDPNQVILGNVGAISKYLSEHPTEAPLILEAENRRVTLARENGKTDEQPRAGLIRAVQAAAAHAAN